MRDRMQVDTGTGVRRNARAGALHGPETRAKGRLNDMIKVLIFIAVWIVVMKFVLPRFGVPT
jgi:hypothetical protein